MGVNLKPRPPIHYAVEICIHSPRPTRRPSAYRPAMMHVYSTAVGAGAIAMQAPAGNGYCNQERYSGGWICGWRATVQQDGTSTREGAEWWMRGADGVEHVISRHVKVSYGAGDYEFGCCW